MNSPVIGRPSAPTGTFTPLVSDSGGSSNPSAESEQNPWSFTGGDSGPSGPLGYDSMNPSVGMNPETLHTLNGLNTQLETGNQNWAATNIELGSANANWSETNGELNFANGNWSNTNDQLASANQNWDNTNATIDRTNHEWGRTNTTMERLTSPVALGALAASAGAGLVLGAMVARLAISGLVMGTKKLYGYLHEKVTHQLENEALIRGFQAAWKDYRGTMDLSLTLESTLSRLLDLRKELNEVGMTFESEEALGALDLLTGHLQSRRQALEQKWKVQSANGHPAAPLTYKTLVSVKDGIDQLTRVRGGLAKSRHLTLDGVINESYNTLLLVENQLEWFRIDMLSAKKEWFRRLRTALNKQDENIDRILGDARSVYKEGKRATKHSMRTQSKKARSDFKRSAWGFTLEIRTRKLPREDLKAQLVGLRQELGEKGGGTPFPHGIDAPSSRWRWLVYRLFGTTYPLEYEIGKVRAALKCVEDFPESAPGQFLSWRQAAIKKGGKEIIAALKASYIGTLKKALLLRQDPEQSAEVLLANLNQYFDDIAADQVAFNSGVSSERKVTHARKLAGRFNNIPRTLRGRLQPIPEEEDLRGPLPSL